MLLTFGIQVPGGVFLPSMVVGALQGHFISLCIQHFQPNLNNWHIKLSAEPVLYAMVGAASVISGLTRMTVSLIIIMFELTGSLTFVVPLMLAIMVSKWTSDAIEKHSIYDRMIQSLNYPYLDHKRTFFISGSLQETIEVNCESFQVNLVYSFIELEQKLQKTCKVSLSFFF
jgi:chloride channel 3/4/5